MRESGRETSPTGPCGLARILLSLSAVTAVAALVVITVTACGAARPGSPGDARRADTPPRGTRAHVAQDGSAVAGRRCADAAPVRSLRSERPGARRELVPGRPIAVLLCRYDGFQEPGIRAPGFGLVGSRSIGGVAARSLAAQLDALRPDSARGAISCPEDDGSSLIAVFRYGSGASDPVTIGLRGCETATNGPVSRLALFSPPLVPRLVELTPSRPALQHANEATIDGRVRVCGGAAIAPACRPAGKSFRLVVRVFGPNGDWTDLAGIGRSARFDVLVVPGRSRVELIHDWWDGHPRVLEERSVVARPGRAVRVELTVEVK